MKQHSTLRTLARGFALTVVIVVLMLAMLMAVVASSGCATTKIQGSETLIRDSTSLRVAQRLVAVAVPGDSAKLSTRVVYDEASHRFKPVTIFSGAGRSRLAFQLDAYGLVTLSGYTVPYVAQVTVTDTTRSRTRLASTKEVVTVAAPKSRFVKFCIGFTLLVIVACGGWAYTRFFTPFRLF